MYRLKTRRTRLFSVVVLVLRCACTWSLTPAYSAVRTMKGSKLETILITCALLLPGGLGYRLRAVGIRHSLDRSSSSSTATCLHDVLADGSQQAARQFVGGGVGGSCERGM